MRSEERSARHLLTIQASGFRFFATIQLCDDCSGFRFRKRSKERSARHLLTIQGFRF
jgi:hypothetical protein